MQSGAQLRRDGEGLPQAIALEEDRRRGKHCHCSASPKSLLYSDTCATPTAARFHDAFRRSSVLVLIYDDFRADNEATMRTVLRFLGVDEHVAIAAQRTQTADAVCRSVGSAHVW